MKDAINDNDSIMEEAFNYVNIMTTEAQVTLSEYLKHLALTIHFSGPKKERIKLQFVKVWATPPKSNDQDGIARSVELSFERTRMKLLTVLKAIWKDKSKSDGAPRQKMPDYLQSIIKFREKGHHLTELILTAIVLVDYCLELTTKATANNITLLQFVRDLFKGVSTFMNAWRLLEYLLRVKVWEDEATLVRIKEHPNNGQTILIGAVYSLYPEKVRDWAFTTIHGFRKRKGDLFFSDLVTEKDASAWAFRIIGHLYSKPDHKFGHDINKLPLLHLKMPTKAESGYEKSRHTKLMGVGQYSERPSTAEGEKVEPDKNDEKDDADEESKGVESDDEEEHSEKSPLIINFDSDHDDDVTEPDVTRGAVETIDPPGDSVLASVNIADISADPPSDDVLPVDTAVVENDKDNTDEDDHNENNNDAVCPNKRLDPIIKWKGLATNKDLEKRNYRLEYLSPDRVTCVFELGKMDHIHHTRLEQVPHLLSNTNSTERTHEKKRGGSVFVPRDESHVIYDYGIFRYDDTIMKQHRDLLNDVDFNLILAFMCKHGFIDRKRDKGKTGCGYAIQPLRVSVGSADHSFEYRHSEKERKGTMWNFVRDLPRNDCGVALMTKFNARLPKEIGKLMDFEALLLRDKFKSINTPMDGVLQDGFIYSVFTEPFVNLFSCKECRFPCFDLTVMDAEDDPLPDENGKFHTDGDNGILSGNDISTTVSLFFRSKKIVDSLLEDGLQLDEATKKAELLLRGKQDVERLKRFYMIFFTRRAHEQFRDNEAMAENFKTLLHAFRDRLDRNYAVFGGSFAKPQDMSFLPNVESSLLSNEPINGLEYACYKMSPSYAREIYCAGGMTVLYGVNVILAECGKTRRKMLELYVVALSMGSWFKFYYSGMELLATIKDHVDENLVVLLLRAMKTKFGSWNGGPQHRGRPTNVDLLSHYQVPANVDTAVIAMDKFLVVLETKPDLKLEEFKTELTIMVSSLVGVGEHYGMNLGLYAGLTGLLSTNLHNCFLAYPIEGQGSANTIEAQDKILQVELDGLRSKEGVSGAVIDRTKEIGLKADLKGYHQTIRLVSSFCGIQQRHCWIETMCCDGIGPNQYKFDYVFPRQSMFWFHSVGGREDDIRRMTFVVRRKQWGSQIWTDIQKFF